MQPVTNNITYDRFEAMLPVTDSSTPVAKLQRFSVGFGIEITIESIESPEGNHQFTCTLVRGKFTHSTTHTHRSFRHARELAYREMLIHLRNDNNKLLKELYEQL